jgi:hypothetical protein
MCVRQYSKLSKLAAFKIHKYAYSIQCLTMDVYATDLEQSSILWRMKSSILFPLATLFSMCLSQDNSFLMLTLMNLLGSTMHIICFHVVCRLLLPATL